MGDQTRDGAAGGRQAGGRDQGADGRPRLQDQPLQVWLSLAVDELNKDPAGIVHCWEGTELLRAWEGPVQAEACGMDKKILFPEFRVQSLL